MADNIKEKIKEFDNLIKKHPDIQELYIGRALLYTKIKQYKKALQVRQYPQPLATRMVAAIIAETEESSKCLST